MAVPVIGTIMIGVFVGLGVRVAVGRTIVGLGSSRFVGVLDGMNGVRVEVGVRVGDAVSVGLGVNDAVGVEVATSF